MVFDQSDFALRCEWGEQGVNKLALVSDVVVIVNVLSFSTCVESARSIYSGINHLHLNQVYLVVKIALFTLQNFVGTFYMTCS